MNKKELAHKAIELGSKLNEKELLKLSVSALEGIVEDLEMKAKQEAEIEEMKAMMAKLLEQKVQPVEDTTTIHSTFAMNSEKRPNTIFASSPIVANSIALSKRQLISDIPNDRYVQIMNGTHGVLFWRSPVTHMDFKLLKYGDVEEIPFAEIKTMKNRNPRMLKENAVIILDQDIAEALGLSSQYENILLPENIKDILLDFQALKTYYASADNMAKNVLITFAIKMYHRNELIDLNVIRFLEKEYKIEFEQTITDARDDLI